jgi:Ca2+-transporting ATPase
MPDRVVSALGLTAAQARHRLEEYGPNLIVARRRTRLLTRIGNQLKDPLIVLLLIAAPSPWPSVIGPTPS